MVQVKTIGEKLDRPVYVRIKFEKTGSLQYISHLDLVRTMHKVLIRSRMPLWFTEGFNPKPKMIFASSMSVGLESLCEFLDVRITHKIDLESACDALNFCLTPDLRVTEVYYPESEFTGIAFARYEININSEFLPENAAKKCEEVLLSKPLCVMKRTKSGEQNVDISPFVKEVKATLREDGSINISVLLCVNNTVFLSAEYLVVALKNELGILSGNLLLNTYSICRTAMYNADMTAFK